jgi:MoaA/NifB/PqqE/SkfB family radical SAM enzyme
LTKKDILRTLESLKGYNYNEVSLTGGEPLLRNDLFECIEFAHKLGLLTSIDTNGTLLDTQCIRRLLKSGLDSAFVSLDDLDGSSHDVNRGLHKKTMHNLRQLIKTDIAVCISTTVSLLNLDKIVDMCKFCERNGIRIVFHPVYLPKSVPLFGSLSLQKATADQLGILKNQLKYYAERFNVGDYVELFLSCITGTGKRPAKCSQGEKSLVIESDGGVFPCFHRRDTILGNILTIDWNDMFTKLKEKRREIEKAECFGEHCVSLFCPFNI